MSQATGLVRLFVGVLAERSPAQGAKTLFVVGAPPAHEIVRHAVQQRVAHVQLGAHHPRNPVVERFDPHALDWPRVIDDLLIRQLRVTLEYPPEHHTWVLAHCRRFFDRKGFLAQLVVPLPHDLLLHPDAFALKLEQGASEVHDRGVWVWPAAQLRAAHRHTSVGERPEDEVVLRG